MVNMMREFFEYPKNDLPSIIKSTISVTGLQGIWRIFKEWILDNWKGFPLIHDFEFCFPRPINLLWEMLLTIDNASGAKRGRIEEINIYFVKQIFHRDHSTLYNLRLDPSMTKVSETYLPSSQNASFIWTL